MYTFDTTTTNDVPADANIVCVNLAVFDNHGKVRMHGSTDERSKDLIGTWKSAGKTVLVSLGG